MLPCLTMVTKTSDRNFCPYYLLDLCNNVFTKTGFFSHFMQPIIERINMMEKIKMKKLLPLTLATTAFRHFCYGNRLTLDIYHNPSDAPVYSLFHLKSFMVIKMLS